MESVRWLSEKVFWVSLAIWETVPFCKRPETVIMKINVVWNEESRQSSFSLFPFQVVLSNKGHQPLFQSD